MQDLCIIVTFLTNSRCSHMQQSLHRHYSGPINAVPQWHLVVKAYQRSKVVERPKILILAVHKHSHHQLILCKITGLKKQNGYVLPFGFAELAYSIYIIKHIETNDKTRIWNILTGKADIHTLQGKRGFNSNPLQEHEM